MKVYPIECSLFITDCDGLSETRYIDQLRSKAQCALEDHICKRHPMQRTRFGSSPAPVAFTADRQRPEHRTTLLRPSRRTHGHRFAHPWHDPQPRKWHLDVPIIRDMIHNHETDTLMCPLVELSTTTKMTLGCIGPSSGTWLCTTTKLAVTGAVTRDMIYNQETVTWSCPSHVS